MSENEETSEQNEPEPSPNTEEQVLLPGTSWKPEYVTDSADEMTNRKESDK